MRCRATAICSTRTSFTRTRARWHSPTRRSSRALIAAPLLWLGVNQVLVYNLLLLAGIVSSGAGMFVLVALPDRPRRLRR